MSRAAFGKFQKWVEDLADNTGASRVMLVAHNGCSCDFIWLKAKFLAVNARIPDDWLWVDSMRLAGQIKNVGTRSQVSATHGNTANSSTNQQVLKHIV